MATHSSTLAWRISWMEEPGGLQSTRSQLIKYSPYFSNFRSNNYTCKFFFFQILLYHKHCWIEEKPKLMKVEHTISDKCKSVTWMLIRFYSSKWIQNLHLVQITHTLTKIKKAGRQRIDAFKARCQSRPSRVPWTARISNQSILKIGSECSMEGLMLKLKLQYFGHLMQRVDSLEKTLMMGKIEGGRRRGWQRMRWLDGVTDSMDMSLREL